MRSILDSDAIGEVWNHVRDQLPDHARKVRLAVKVRMDHDGALPRPSRRIPPPRVIPRNVEARAQREQLRVLYSVIAKSGTGPKFEKPGGAARPIAGLLTYQPEPYVHVTTREERIAARIGRKRPSERLEPLLGWQRCHEVLSSFVGPLTRQQQAEYAFVCASYGVVYA